jgi:hypothetical protein
MDKKPNLSNISPELKEKMLQWEKQKPEFRQLQVMEDVADMVQELVTLGDGSKDATEKLGTLLMDAREQLIKLNAKESPESPDFAKPIVEMLGKLEKAFTSKDFKPTIKVDAPKIPTPVVNVEASNIDVSGIEKLLKTEVPKAFEKAISLIPEPEKQDNSDILSKFDEMFEWLESIDTATRKKPLPGSMIVTNPDGSVVGNQPLTNRYDYDDATTIYTATAPIGTSDASTGWTITKYDLTDTNNASGKIATDVSWTNRGTGDFN